MALAFSQAAIPPLLAAQGKPQAHRASVKGKIEFRLLVEKTRVKPAEPIFVKFALKNLGKKPVWVNTRCYLSSPRVPGTEREVTLTVTGPKGTGLPCTYSYETGLPKSDDFTRLEPGQEVVSEHQHNLQGYFEFTEKGTYTIVGMYENVFGPELGLAAFTGPVASQPVSITLAD